MINTSSLESRERCRDSVNATYMLSWTVEKGGCVKRSVYFDEIEQRLSFLATRIEVRGKLNILDLNLHSEYFYQDLLRLFFGWQLTNQNQVEANAAGLDLIEESRRLIVQVTGTASKQKLQKSLGKIALDQYGGYTFKFVAIAGNAGPLRSKEYVKPNGIFFDPKVDIIDVASLLKKVQSESLGQQRKIFDFLKEELGLPADSARIDSQIAKLIGLLSEQDLEASEGHHPLAFDVEKKIEFNELGGGAQVLIHDHKVHHVRIQSIYDDFDKEGVNKSRAVLSYMRRKYAERKGQAAAHDIFFGIVKDVVDESQTTAIAAGMTIEELDLCAQIVVVDAFLRCKIFQNPEELPR